jgi:hypothetical protein
MLRWRESSVEYFLWGQLWGSKWTMTDTQQGCREERTWKRNKCLSVGFKVLTVMTIMSTIFSNVSLCIPVDVHWSLVGVYRFQFQSPRVSKASNEQEVNIWTASFFFFDEEGGNGLIWNTAELQDYTASHSRRQHSSHILLFQQTPMEKYYRYPKLDP